MPFSENTIHQFLNNVRNRMKIQPIIWSAWSVDSFRTWISNVGQVSWGRRISWDTGGPTRCINYREFRYKVFEPFVISNTVSKLTVIYVPSLGGLWLGLSLHLSPFWANGSVKKCARLWRTRQFYRRGMLGAHFGQVSQLYMRSSGM